ncbi:TonB-dependent receptor [Algoriphagus namhaensis]
MMILAVAFCFSLASFAQDTVSLSEVEVYAPKLERFAQGQKVSSLKKIDLEDFAARSLGDLMQERTPIFIRQYGAGMLASPSFRGTSAGHTALFWNGLPINSPSLGQSDLSILPVQAFDEVQLQYGSSGALFGNEAIGGSIHLASAARFDQGFQAQLSQQLGSFGLTNTGLSIGFSGGKFSTRSRFYRFQQKNDFPYADLGRPETPTVRQDHAEVSQRGWVQDMAWNLKANQQVKLAYWWNEADREIQPVMGSEGQDQQRDVNHRLALDYSRFGNSSTLTIKTGLVFDRQRFNAAQNDTDTYFLSADWDENISPSWSLKVGGRYTRAEGRLSTYSTVDERFEGYQSVRFIPSEKIHASVNLRQIAYTEGDLPFLPWVGLDWEIFSRPAYTALLKVSGGKGFKIPTLNDRFWQPGGNLNLLPEESLNGEIGLHLAGKAENSWDASLTYYQMDVDNWIIWLPQGNIWTPENIRNVQNQGLELDAEWKGESGVWQWTLRGNYAYSLAVSTQENARDLIQKGSQLPYTPKHQANAIGRIERKGFDLTLSTFFVGARSVTADALRQMPSYQLVNLGLGYRRFQIGETKIPISFQINNLFNTEYQVLYLRAMPGISYQLNLIISL